MQQELPAPGMDPAARERAMRLMVAEGATAWIIVSLLQGNFLTGLLLHLGAAPYVVGIAVGLPLLATLAQLPGGFLVYRVRALVPFMAWIFGLHRFIWAAAGLLALALPRAWAVPVYLGMLLVSFVLAGAGSPAWQSMSAEVVPLERRGAYFGRRSSILQTAVVITTLSAGALVDWLGQGWGFAALYGLAGAVTVVNVVLLRAHPEPPRQQSAPGISLRTPLRQRDFRAAIIVFAVWNFCQSLAVPYFSVRMIRDMHLAYTLMSAMATLAGLATVLVMSTWGRWVDRAGEDRVIATVLPATALVPLGWLLAGWGGIPLLAVLHLIQATSLAGLQFTFFTLSMRLAPQQGRALYLATFTAAGGLAGGLAPLLSGWLARESLPPRWHLGLLTGDRLDAIFWLAGAVSLVFALWWLRRVHRRPAQAGPQAA